MTAGAPATSPVSEQGAAERADQRAPILFVGGYARSGSTLLDCMLGQVPGFVSTGELEFIWGRGLVRNEPCGCGVAFLECPFWTEVLKEAYGGGGPAQAEAGRALHRSVERIRNLPGLAARGLRRSALRRELDEYAGVLRPLYAAIRSVSGCDVIIDSSKDPVHGFALAALHDVDLHVVHLLRDSRAVAFSLQRVKRRAPGPGADQLRRLDPLKASLGWDVANALTGLLRLRASSFIRVRYAELIHRPRDVIRAIVESVAGRATVLDFVTEEGIHLEPTHTVSGNPSRFNHGLVTLSLDSEWQRHMRRRDRAVVTGLTWPLLLRYGFLGRDGGPG